MNRQRILSIGGGALLINVLLFIVMEAMSVQQPLNIKAPESVLSIDFVRLKRQPEPPQTKPREIPPEKKPPQENLLTNDLAVPKPQPLRIKDINMELPRLDLAMNVAGVPFLGKMAETGLNGLTEAIPLVRTAPLYPPNALNRRIEGHVKVLFTVNEEGKVIDPKVIAADPPNIFNSSALRAIRRWKFRKKIDNGLPVSWQSVQTIIFKLEK